MAMSMTLMSAKASQAHQKTTGPARRKTSGLADGGATEGIGTWLTPVSDSASLTACPWSHCSERTSAFSVCEAQRTEACDHIGGYGAQAQFEPSVEPEQQIRARAADRRYPGPGARLKPDGSGTAAVRDGPSCVGVAASQGEPPGQGWPGRLGRVGVTGYG